MKAIGIVIGLTLMLSGCSPHRVTPERAKELVAKGARLVDVRSPEEFQAGHLSGAINIPVGNLEARLSELEPKSEPIVVYCRSGLRSAKASRILAAAGFTQIADLGGMSRWPP